MKRQRFDQYVNKQDKILSEDINEAWYNPKSWFGGNKQQGKNDQSKRIMTNKEQAQVKRTEQLRVELMKWVNHVIDDMWPKIIQRLLDPKGSGNAQKYVETLFGYLTSPEQIVKMSHIAK